ncbi:MAG: hypothetical protein H0U04_02730 [Rubrobacter sp.]|nr:hypothetical protein [Rubrobacter sp.]
MFKWYVALILVTEIATLLLFLPLTVPDSLALLLAPVVPVTVIVALLMRSRRDSVSRGAWRLSPERITGHIYRAPRADSPEAISRSIVERTAEIQRALQEEPDSEVRLEMCALGYRACVNDMITLTHLVNEQTPNAPLFQRLRLRRARKRAIESLSATRQALPPGLLRAEHQERQ